MVLSRSFGPSAVLRVDGIETLIVTIAKQMLDLQLDNLSPKEADRIEHRLNHRPRKCLGYLTPYEAFNDTQELLTVALRC